MSHDAPATHGFFARLSIATKIQVFFGLILLGLVVMSFYDYLDQKEATLKAHFDEFAAGLSGRESGIQAYGK